jgi:hypothetical protein
MPEMIIYPKRPCIGVDCSGQPKSPPMIAVATRWSRRDKENKWIVRVAREQIEKHCSKRDWQEKIYASIVFKALDRVLQPNYDIHIDRDFPDPKKERKIKEYLKYLIGCHHAGDPTKENPNIFFKTRRSSEYVMEAHVKHGLAKDDKLKIDEKTNLDYLMKLLN